MRWTHRTPAVRLLTTGLLACLGCLLATPADAQVTRVGALPPRVTGTSAATELRDKFQDAVIRGLADPSSEVMGAAETRQRLGGELLACAGAACVPRAIAALQVERAVVTELNVTGKSYTIALKLYDARGQELTRADDACEICTVHEAEETVTKAAARLATAARSLAQAPPPPTIPPPAEPAAPVLVAPPEPSPAVQPAAPPLVASPTRTRRYVPWSALAWSSLGAGLVGLGVGVPLLVLDGRPTCNAADPVHQCPRVYDTRAGGATLVALGTLGLIASIPLFYFDWREKNRSLAALGVRGGALAGGAGLQLLGRFW